MQTDGVPPTIVLIQKLTGTWVAQCISVAAKLGTADALAEGPKGAEELAAPANAHAPSKELKSWRPQRTPTRRLCTASCAPWLASASSRRTRMADFV